MSAILQQLTFENQTGTHGIELARSTFDEADNSAHLQAILDAKAINSADQMQVLIAMALTFFVILGVLASCATLTVWAGYSVATAISNWSLQDLMQGIHGNM